MILGSFGVIRAQRLGSMSDLKFDFSMYPGVGPKGTSDALSFFLSSNPGSNAALIELVSRRSSINAVFSLAGGAGLGGRNPDSQK